MALVHYVIDVVENEGGEALAIVSRGNASESFPRDTEGDWVYRVCEWIKTNLDEQFDTPNSLGERANKKVEAGMIKFPPP